MRKMILAVLFVGLFALCAFGGARAEHSVNPIDQAGEHNHKGGLSNWVVWNATSNLKGGQPFTIQGDYTSIDAYSDNSFVSITWPGPDGVIHAGDSALVWWHPTASSVSGSTSHFIFNGTASSYGLALVQVSFENADNLEISYVQGYADFAAGNTTPPTPKPVIQQVMEFGSENLLWILIIIVILILVVVARGPLSLVLALIALGIFAGMVMGWLPKVDIVGTLKGLWHG